MGRKSPLRYWLTGAGNGVGAALAQALLETGAWVAVSTCSAQTCEALSTRYPGQVLPAPGNLSDSQTVREIGEFIAQRWGGLDRVILNAGTAEYVCGQPPEEAMIEHIVRSNLLAASFCIETARPLLGAGTDAHLVGIASPVTYLTSLQATGGRSLRELFDAARHELAAEGIDVTLVTPGIDSTSLNLDDCFPKPAHWSADDAAAYILGQLTERPDAVTLSVSCVTALWPLSQAEAQAAPGDPTNRTDQG
ncbi:MULTISPECIES: SDR family NAD(P)-dependent oxidoreductase [Pseudomonas]|uniref:SDR family NAD(P)-dependent oxidoreductase n=1 Tax=Pseudomonas TaxID=286 RepID=UPI001BE9AEC9|nr:MULTISPECIES: SDR family oxidoreductase [Pseudomonas]MBT2340833.1 SDR family oxidoreductase [Pseudomonas fluorescens]MCD4531347.1 SDR family oxidoreductase [Pseudomonas sp. C3-2018]